MTTPTSARSFQIAAQAAFVLAALGLPLAASVPLAYVPRRPLAPLVLAHPSLYLAVVLAALAGIVARAAHRHPAARRTSRRAFTLAGVDFAIVAATWIWLAVSVARGR